MTGFRPKFTFFVYTLVEKQKSETESNRMSKHQISKNAKIQNAKSMICQQYEGVPKKSKVLNKTTLEGNELGYRNKLLQSRSRISANNYPFNGNRKEMEQAIKRARQKLHHSNKNAADSIKVFLSIQAKYQYFQEMVRQLGGELETAKETLYEDYAKIEEAEEELRQLGDEFYLE